MGKKAPKAPDPVATANAQAAMNRETAITQMGLNAMDQFNPWGSVTYTQQGTWEDGTPRFQQTTSYTPEQQAIFDQTQQTQTNLANIASEQSAFLQDYLNTPFTFDNNDASNWAYDLGASRILPQQARNEANLRSTLAAKGIREGTPAWDSEMARLTNANTDQLNQLALQGRSQAYNEALTGRNQPINEIIGLMNGSQLQNPGTSSPATPQSGVAGVDYAGLVNSNYQNQVNAYNAQLGGIGGLFGSVLGAAGSAGGFGALFSDRRLKTEIMRVGETPAGLGVYLFKYKAGSVADDGGKLHRGVMAQEVQRMFPEAVSQHETGALMVDYGRIG